MHKTDFVALALAGPIGLTTKRVTENLLAKPFETTPDNLGVYIPKEFERHLLKAEGLMEDWHLIETEEEMPPVIDGMYSLLAKMDEGYRHPNRTTRISKKRLAEMTHNFYEMCDIIKHVSV